MKMNAELPLMPHWTNQLATLTERFGNAERILLATDFDGTLAPIVNRPSEATLSDNTVEILTDLARLHPRVQLAFLSGRSLSDLKTRVGMIPSATLAGNHGLEISSGGREWIHPSVAGIRSDLDSLLAILKSKFSEFPGVELEDKGLSLTLHYRRINPERSRDLLSAIESLQPPDTIRRHDGKMVIEYRPNIHWNKGTALRKIAGDLEVSYESVVYLGDDITDEDAFRELYANGTTIHVGGGSWSCARLHATDPGDVARFLGTLVEMVRS